LSSGNKSEIGFVGILQLGFAQAVGGADISFQVTPDAFPLLIFGVLAKPHAGYFLIGFGERRRLSRRWRR
jgi:hypothetical protein